ncbi:putative cation antiporter NADH dehydrogenase subunit [Plantactinospora endophytica]|uniref:Cation antiporter NADH dehydrogenase subunit n=1 Tax=Plantactinospora endophytica TaxID=673535 RepID=A0ABQ4DW79_9ACTN|nr:putative cation antiporter NADH dehydrogenase subunit [Plantactinospora endophytica]
MLMLLALHLVAAALAPALVRLWGRWAFLPLALAPAAAFGWALGYAGTIGNGTPVVETYRWVPELGLDLALRVGTLSWLLVLLVGGIGALVLVYCVRYFAAGEPDLGRFAAAFVGFAGAMLGVVVADDLLLLYIFWELTSVFSYLLIAHHCEQPASRRAATQALLVTTLGGLVMLIGFVMLGQHAGTYRWSEIAARPPPSGGYLGLAVVLILIGALSKSAIFPTSFWLPAAMAAPTPVSAYLHAAAMVKAGVYLVAMLAPAYADVGPWRPLVYVAGVVTMLAGAWAALRQVDLKLLLAYGTVSRLGLLVVLLGTGTPDAALAGAAMLLGHALFKAALFLVVGIVDRRAGTRDLTVLSGLWRRMPLVCVAAVLAAASMAGVPPLFGFVTKEAAFAALADDPLLLAALLLSATLSTAYATRFVWGAFADRPGAEPTPTRPVEAVLLAPAGLLAVAGLVLGVLAGAVGGALAGYPRIFGTIDHHLTLLPAPGLALGLSLLALVAGLLLFALRGPVGAVQARLRAPVDGDSVYQALSRGLDRFAVLLTGATQRGSLPQYLGIILLAVVLVLGGALLRGPRPERIGGWDNPLQAVVGAVLVVAAVLTVRARRRLAAVILVGVTGYCTAMLFVLHGAPDLALAQFLAETVTIVVFVLVLRRLPARFSVRPLRRSRWARLALGVAVGVVVAGTALAATEARRAPPVSAEFPGPARSFGYGRNIVNVTLVDIRAWDTMGEIAVLVVAATGVASLIFQRRRGPERPRRGDLPPPPGAERVWLRAGPTLRTRHRSIVFEVVVRLIFHTVVLFSIFLLFAGHNAPGGGFVGGLVAGLALAVRYLAGGRHELDQAAPVDAGVVLGVGLFVAVGTGLLAMSTGGEVLRSTLLKPELPLVGDVHLVTSIFSTSASTWSWSAWCWTSCAVSARRWTGRSRWRTSRRPGCVPTDRRARPSRRRRHRRRRRARPGLTSGRPVRAARTPGRTGPVPGRPGRRGEDEAQPDPRAGCRGAVRRRGRPAAGAQPQPGADRHHPAQQRRQPAAPVGRPGGRGTDPRDHAGVGDE